jgi:hypothetical protein
MYTPEQLDEIRRENTRLASKLSDMSAELIRISTQLRSEAREHAIHGIARRLSIIRQCLLFFISQLPPDQEIETDTETRISGNAHLHAFLMNCVGICDNIAWVIAFQRKLDHKLDFGQRKKRRFIGVFNLDFEKHLSPNVLSAKERHAEWFKGITSQRDPVAHRIPPYIIPYIVIEKTLAHDYTPFYMHSLKESPLVPLHAQCIADAGAIVELVEALLEDIPAIT